MAIWWDSPVAPEAQTTFMREVPLTANNGLLNLFSRQTSDTNTLDFSEIVQTNRMAQYRAYDGRIHVSERDGGSGKRVSIAPLSTSLNESEFERVMQEIVRNQGNTRSERLMNAIYNDSQKLTQEVNNRLEMAWGDVLTDGILSINEGGLGGSAGTADYGVPGTHKATVSTSWDSYGSSTVISDLQVLVDRYIDTNGFAPGSILTSNVTQRKMRRSNEVVDLAYGTADTRTRVQQSDLQDVLSDELNGLQLRDPYDAAFTASDGTTQRTIADDRVILLPPNVDDLGYTVWGVCATALELVNSNEADFSFEEAPGIVGVIENVGPPYRKFTFVDACAMPVLSNAKLLAVLKTTV